MQLHIQTVCAGAEREGSFQMLCYAKEYQGVRHYQHQTKTELKVQLIFDSDFLLFETKTTRRKIRSQLNFGSRKFN